MNITGSVHCFFEQSGTFKNEFKKLGIKAFDYDIQNEFGETDFVIDLFSEIDNAFDGNRSIFDNICRDDLIFAFFPCIYFSAVSQINLYPTCRNYRNLSDIDKARKIVERSRERDKYYCLLVKFFAVVRSLGIRMILENPYSEQTYLKSNFESPTLVDNDRSLRGDFRIKPTAYWFVNCSPTYGESIQRDKIIKTHDKCKQSKVAGVCSAERSLISPDYARNFICDFVLGKEQNFGQSTFNF